MKMSEDNKMPEEVSLKVQQFKKLNESRKLKKMAYSITIRPQVLFQSPTYISFQEICVKYDHCSICMNSKASFAKSDAGDGYLEVQVDRCNRVYLKISKESRILPIVTSLDYTYLSITNPGDKRCIFVFRKEQEEEVKSFCQSLVDSAEGLQLVSPPTPTEEEEEAPTEHVPH